jgi:hypothetical protein
LSVAAVMLVKDEADIIEYVVAYMVGQVDHLIVCDNGSTDGTLDALHALSEETPFEIRADEEVAYYQARKTTELAAYALALGHQWVVPCDADELWYATDGRTIREFLGGLAPDVAYVSAELYNHLPTALDPLIGCSNCGGTGWYLGHEDVGAGYGDVRIECEHGPIEPNPFLRIGWRQREHGALPKVAARLRPGLEIRQGNHSAYAPGSGMSVGGLCVRHFSWRSVEQYVRKIANGYVAYAATTLPEDMGGHWRMFGAPDDPTFEERVAEHFRQWFYVRDPGADSSLIYDPAPWSDPSAGVGSET